MLSMRCDNVGRELPAYMSWDMSVGNRIGTRWKKLPSTRTTWREPLSLPLPDTYTWVSMSSSSSTPGHHTPYVSPRANDNVQDYSYDGARTRLDFYLPKESAELSKKRWAIINIWRPIYPITRENLTLLDARSISDAELRPIIAKFRRPDDAEKLPPITRAAYNRNDVETWSVAAPKTPEQHQWYYCSHMDPSEVLFIKIFDSSEQDGVARRTPHTAFTCDEDCGDQRQSIELRSLVFWDD